MDRVARPGARRRAWKAPLLRELAVRHAIDGMHLQKNVFDSTIRFLSLLGKAKDELKSCKDLVDFQIRLKLQPQEFLNGKQYLPPTSYNLTPDERLAMCKCLRGLKVLTGFSSNNWSLVSLKDMMLASYNSHDCHVMIIIFLAITIRAIKPVFVRMVITRMCYFFNVISQKVIDCVKLVRLQLLVLET
uniref:Uncharacterized protein n=1 Tax=Setaria italica TaxID=4555 RepID=K3YE81_SETIT